MLQPWTSCKNILCIRADNMGDLLMSTPAIRALKESFNAKITVLTSSMAAGIAQCISEIDEVITYNFPWVKLEDSNHVIEFQDIIDKLKTYQFDAVVIFSVYSQNTLPAAMLAYLAEIPLRLAYCRENPYYLLTHWVPDIEPYSTIKHQVKRDLDLVSSVGAYTNNDQLSISILEDNQIIVHSILSKAGVQYNLPWVILHAGVSEEKRKYPFNLWVQTAQHLINDLGYQVLLTGSNSEKILTDQLQQVIGKGAFSLGGCFVLKEFISLIQLSPMLISVNTGTIHLAAALQTPVVVLYALTNPQHFPWKVKGKVLTFTVPAEKHSKNEVIRYVNQKLFPQEKTVQPSEIIEAVKIIIDNEATIIPELYEVWT